MKLLKYTNLAILFAVALGGVILTALDVLERALKISILPTNIPEYQIIIVSILCFLSIHLVFYYIETTNHRKRVEIKILRKNPSLGEAKDEILRTIRSLDVVYVETFETDIEREDYITYKIRRAKTKVCDLTWKPKSGTNKSEPKKEAEQKYSDGIKYVSERIPYQEIFYFTKDAPTRVKKLMKRREENRPKYSCRYIPEETAGNIPRLQYVLIDSEEIIFSSSSGGLAFKSKQFGNVLQMYFDSVWKISVPIKEIDGDFDETICRELIGKYQPQSTSS